MISAYKIALGVALVAIISCGSEAHLTAICTSTSSSTPGRIDFYFGTYHGKIRAPRGTVHLMNTGGTKATGNFKEAFHVTNRNDHKFGTPKQDAQELSDPLLYRQRSSRIQGSSQGWRHMDHPRRFQHRQQSLDVCPRRMGHSPILGPCHRAQGHLW